MAYLFSDTDRAARRLKVLEEVFALSTRPFIEDVVSSSPDIALDLGCGPGYTTHLLADTTGCVQAIGLDNSAHFIALANSDATEHTRFLRHDVTQVPFPVGPADLIFCRMLLTHLQDPQSVIERWSTQLQGNGLLLLEEVEWIRTERPLFRMYLDLVAAMLGQQANELYIGSLLDKQSIRNGLLRRRLSRVYQLSVSTAQAATMFYLNVQAWKNHPFVQEHYEAHVIDTMENDLQELSINSTAHGEILWGMRQIAYEHV